MLVHSSAVKRRNRLAFDILHTFAPHAGLVDDVH